MSARFLLSSSRLGATAPGLRPRAHICAALIALTALAPSSSTWAPGLRPTAATAAQQVSFAMTASEPTPAVEGSRNVFGEPLELCCTSPQTGFYRDGYCCTGPQDMGVHTVCARVTAEFLEFSRSRGNDLMTPHPEYSFPGLKPGDRWCLCASRWEEARRAGFAPPVHLRACHEKTLSKIEGGLEELMKYSVE